MDYILDKNTYFATPQDKSTDKLQVEVGDSKQVDFYPQVKLMRWDNEVNFSVRLVHDEATPSISQVADKISWDGEKIKSDFYNIAPSSDYKEGGYEFDITLKEKPASNKIQFTIQSKGLEFCYQPFLKNQNGDDSTWEDDAEGKSIRLANISGSYAVFYKGCHSNFSGGKEYKTGKAFHIYRPKIQDANGEWVWGELNIDELNGILTVTIPQEFLDKAIYPVRQAAGLVIGYDTIGGTGFIVTSQNNDVANMVSQHSASTGDAVTLFTLYGTRVEVNELAVYTVVAGVPVNRLDVAASIVDGTGAPQWWNTSAVNQSMSNGVTYCVVVGWSGSDINCQIFYDNGSAPGRFNGSSNNLTTPFVVSGTDSGRHYSWYATYTAGGGALTSSLSDSVLASDTLSTLIDNLYLSLSDTTLASDTLNPLIPTLLTTITDNVLATDTISPLIPTLLQVLADNILETDALTVLLSALADLSISLTDNINCSDILNPLIPILIQKLVDNIIETDSINPIIPTLMKKLVDSISVSDLLSIAEKVGRTYFIYESASKSIVWYVEGIEVGRMTKP